jgi:hypothetical protein
VIRVSDYQPCRVPLRRFTLFDRPVVGHEGIIAACKRVEDRWRARGGHAAYRVHTVYIYNCRKTRSGSSWSKHSWGVAIDINPAENPYAAKRGACRTNMPAWFVQLWLDEGFGWGGNWRTVCDSMHMSRFPNEGGSGALYDGQASPDTQEDEMALWRDVDGVEEKDTVWMPVGSRRVKIGSGDQLAELQRDGAKVVAKPRTSPVWTLFKPAANLPEKT